MDLFRKAVVSVGRVARATVDPVYAAERVEEAIDYAEEKAEDAAEWAEDVWDEAWED